MLRFGILLTVFSFFLSACDEDPSKPTVELCVLDVATSICICGLKAPNKPVSDLRHEPLIYCDKATAFLPDAWEKYKNYVDGLEAFIQKLRNQAK